MRGTPVRRRIAIAALALAIVGGAHAEPAAGRPPLTLDPARQAYLFDDPEILVRQVMFGLAHAVTLLARACLDVSEEIRRPTQQAYEEWLVRHGERIIDAEQRLARHYFEERAGEATEEDLAAALKLPAQLDLLRTPDRLNEVCASFPEALSRPRYDLDRVHAVHRDEQRLARAIELRAAVAQCRQIAPAESLAAIDAAFADWENGNSAIEAEARATWLEHNGDEEELRRWQSSVGEAIRRRMVSGKVDGDTECRELIAELPARRNSLAAVMADTPPAADGGAK